MPIHPTAIIDAAARIDTSASVGPYVVIEGPVRVGPDVQIGPHVHLLGSTEIGARCRIHAGAVLGDVPQDRAYDGSETHVRIGEETIIREHATVHRGTAAGSATVVGSRCMLMAGSHVGHNCVIGDDVVLVNAVMLSGHVHVDDGVTISGGTGVHQYTRIGCRAMVTGNSRVSRDIPPYMMTDPFGHVAGVNVVGMRRANIDADAREEVKQAYRTLYRSGMLFSKAVEQLRECAKTETGKAILAFVTAESKRGITGRAR